MMFGNLFVEAATVKVVFVFGLEVIVVFVVVVTNFFIAYKCICG